MLGLNRDTWWGGGDVTEYSNYFLLLWQNTIINATYFGSQFQERTVVRVHIMVRETWQPVATLGSWKADLRLHTRSRKTELELRPNPWLLEPTSSDVVPPLKPLLLKELITCQNSNPPGDQVFKYLNLGGNFFIQSTSRGRCEHIPSYTRIKLVKTRGKVDIR